MGILDKDRKHLWAKSGNKPYEEPELDPESILNMIHEIMGDKFNELLGEAEPKEIA